jgi:hypothetical protein
VIRLLFRDQNPHQQGDLGSVVKVGAALSAGPEFLDALIKLLDRNSEISERFADIPDRDRRLVKHCMEPFEVGVPPL